ncbi:MAG: efflux RND transporter periplasmic adaptor subunit [Gammaproteobacteria bacterium]
MNRTRAGLILAAVLLVGAGLGYALSQLGVIGGTSRAMAQGPKTVGDKGRVLYWHDPMVPNVKFDKPGKSPYMDMQLVPVYANDTQTEGAVHVSSSVSQSLGIRLARVEKTAMNPRLAAVGSVAFDERLLELVQARVEGYVTKLYVKSPLEQVRRGERLAEVLSPQWQAVQEEYVALLAAQSERGQSIRNAARRRLSVLGVPDDAVAALEKAGKVRATTTLFAPIDGVVTELSVREGAAFMPGAPLSGSMGLRPSG